MRDIVSAVPMITETAMDSIFRTLADSVTHKDVGLILSQCGVVEAGGSPKWQRMLLALTARQRQDGCGNNVIRFICAALHPSRYVGRPDDFDDVRTAVNVQLAFHGLVVDERGQPRTVTPATTLPEATRRANELRAELNHRAIHADVLRFCRDELLADNYFHCVLEATKSVADKIRERAGVEGDGAGLVDRVFSVQTPLLALNSLRSESEQSEQKGFAHLLKGVFGMFRNVTAHAPRVRWAVERADALNALTVLSFIHHRLDDAIVVPQR